MLEFYRHKKVLITGHTGFKGAWLTRVLQLAGADVSGYSLAPPTEPALFELLQPDKEMHSTIADIRDLPRLKETIQKEKPEIIFHLAAQPLVRDSYIHPVETYEVNVMGTVNLLEACRGYGAIRSIVNITTDKVYQNIERHEGYSEEDVVNGRDPYANSKSCSELITSSYRAAFFYSPDSPAISTARSGNVIGGGDYSKDRIIPDCVRAACGHEPIVIRNPDSIRPYQHVLDCLSGYLLLAEKQYDKSFAGSWNFGPDERDAVNNEQLVQQFCTLWGDNASYVVKPDNGPHESGILRLVTDKARHILGWSPRMNIQEALSLTIEWSRCYNENGDINACIDRQIRRFFHLNPSC